MTLFLPHRCWRMTTREGVSMEVSDWPIEMDGVNWNLMEEPENQVGLPEEHSGRYEQCCAGSSLIYADHDRALRDLAKVCEPVKHLLEVLDAGPPAARPLARRVLGGDRGALPVLADALEEAGTHAELVAHLRSTGPHARGCCFLDLVLGTA